jgi:hypothetical protein
VGSFPAGSPVFVRLRPQDIGRKIHFRVGPEGEVQGPFGVPRFPV